MGDYHGGHLTLNMLVCMSLGALQTNPYNLGTHSECHQYSPAFDPNRCSVMFSYDLIPISQLTLSHPSTFLNDLREGGCIYSPTYIS